MLRMLLAFFLATIALTILDVVLFAVFHVSMENVVAPIYFIIMSPLLLGTTLGAFGIWLLVLAKCGGHFPLQGVVIGAGTPVVWFVLTLVLRTKISYAASYGLAAVIVLALAWVIAQIGSRDVKRGRED